MECLETAIKKPKTWIPTKDDAISNQLIEAYQTGLKDGVEQQQKLVFSKLKENIDKSGSLTLSLIDTIKKYGFTPLDAYLRVESFDRFEIMITVPETDALKDEFLEMYDVISKIEIENRNDLYDVFISFCSTNDHFDENIVSSDGYSLKMCI